MQPPSQSPITVHVNFEEIREVVLKGIGRSSVFLGLGLNAAHDRNFKDYRLSKITKIDLVPPDATDKDIEEFKKEFSFWIIGNGLRELTESFNLFLDRLFDACVAFRFIKKCDLAQDRVEEITEKFNYVSLPDKLAMLKEEANVEPKNISYLLSINKVRNCLTHRRGIVEKVDVGTDDKLHLKWRGIEIFVKTPNGEEYPIIPNSSQEPIELKEGGDVMLRFPERQKSFGIGERIILTAVDLSEICQCLADETNTLGARAIDYAQELGVQRQDT